MKQATILSILLFCCSTCATSAVLRVPDEYPTIQEGIFFAEEGDTVLIAQGTYKGEGNKGIHFPAFAITVMSENGPTETVIDCTGSGRGFIFNLGQPPECRLEGVTVKRGKSVEKGGGLYCAYSSPTIGECIFIDNESDYGGGIYILGGEPQISSCVIFENTAKQRGGGIGIFGGSRAEVHNCTISSNYVNYYWRSFSGYYGGGIYSGLSSPFISNCEINNNHGGGIRVLRGHPDIAGCIVARNRANTGCGIYLEETSPMIMNCTIFGNCGFNSYDDAGGICLTSGSSPTIINSIIRKNAGHEIWEFDGVAKVRYSNVQGGVPGPGNMDIYPEFADSANNDFHISVRSPCINGGTPVDLETDIDGEPRLLGAAVDIGVDEVFLRGPVLRSQPSKIFRYLLKGSGITCDTLEFVNIGTDTLAYELSEPGSEWLYIQGDIEGILAPEQSSGIRLLYIVNELPVGAYSDVISIASNDVFSHKIHIPVDLRIIAHGTLVVPDHFNSIRHAVEFAVDGDTILVRDGTFTGPGNRSIGADRKNLFFISENGPSKTVIDCKNFERAFWFSHCDFGLVQGFTIRNGYSSYDGGAITCTCTDFELRDCILSGNHSSRCGGALKVFHDRLRIENCQFINNTSSNSGAAVRINNAATVLRGSIFSGNNSEWSTLSIFSCEEDDKVRIENCTFSRNTSESGSAVFSAGNVADLRVRSCILWNERFDEIKLTESSADIGFSDIQGGWAGEGNIDEDPHFTDPLNEDYSLLSDSPCIDLGDPDTPPIPWGGDRIDMGAEEFDFGWYLDPDSGTRIRKPDAEPRGFLVEPIDIAGCVEPGENLQGTVRVTNHRLEPRAFDEVCLFLAGPESLDWVIHTAEEIVLGHLENFDIDFNVEIPVETGCGAYQVEIVAYFESVPVGYGWDALRIAEYCTREDQISDD